MAGQSEAAQPEGAAVKPAGRALHFRLESGAVVWGQAWLRVQLEDRRASVALRLFPPGAPSEGVVPPPRGEVAMEVAWAPRGAALQFRGVRGLALPTTQPTDPWAAGRPPGRGGGEGPAWQLSVSMPAGGGDGAEELLLCAVRPERAPVWPTEHSFALDHRVETRWPAHWLRAPGGEPESAMEAPQRPPFNRVAARLRDAMLRATASGASGGSLERWAAAENWFFFSPPYHRYDDHLLPIDEVTALHPDGEYCMSPSDLHELRADADYVRCHDHVARFVLLAWGWDAERDAPVAEPDAEGGQGWKESGALSWRLRHLCLSLLLLGQGHVRGRARSFAASLGADAAWSEDGFGEAAFTLGDARAARAFWDARAAPSLGAVRPGGRSLADVVHCGELWR